MTAQLVRLSRYRVPLYVTENGLYDNDDVRRPSFLIEHVQAVAEAIRRGADVRGYFHWSLVDNFEWAEGWATHFGLLALNRRTGARTPRRSAEVYAAICRANGVPADLTP
ncbi:family 1 glycosylhydrolase [Haliangium sp.]|uniref:family 1 glycosylhydrolase n=1 Tax=Haliangium sp. TaxID=2663208 RepID=UPI003D101136